MMHAAEAIRSHLEALAEHALAAARDCAPAAARAAEIAADALAHGGTLFFCGNGGSAADAQHLATEYVVRFGRERPAARAIALTTDTSLLTAAANDYGFEYVFARQLDALGRPGDVLFLHSTSGASPNLLRAAQAAAARGVRTVALLAAGGGPLRELVELPIVLDTDNAAHAQELQLAIGHAICDRVERRIARGDEARAAERRA